jgi:hypothetical protein
VQCVSSALVVEAIISAEEDHVKAKEQLMVNPKNTDYLQMKSDSAQEVWLYFVSTTEFRLNQFMRKIGHLQRVLAMGDVNEISNKLAEQKIQYANLKEVGSQDRIEANALQKSIKVLTVCQFIYKSNIQILYLLLFYHRDQ